MREPAEQARAADERARAIVDELALIVWTAAPDGTPTFHSPFWFTYTGQNSAAGSHAADYRAAVHPDDFEGVMAQWRRAVTNGEPFRPMEYRLLRHDGVYRWHVANGRPLRDPSGSIVQWIGTAVDIDERRRSDEHLRFLSEAGEVLAPPRQVAELLQTLADRAVPTIADWFGVWMRRPDGSFVNVALSHCNEARLTKCREAIRRYPIRSQDMASEVVRTGQARAFAHITTEMLRTAAHDEAHLAFIEQLDLASTVIAPLVSTGGNTGFLQFANERGGRTFDDSDLRFAEILARRVALAMENNLLYERERRISESFQNAALPKTLPSLPGIALTAVYEAAERDVEVGGDWYDALLLRDGRILLSIGDVAGKGLEAAVLMTNLRNGIRLAALRGLPLPSIFDAVADLLAVDAPDRFATAWIGTLDPISGTLRWASAGHPPAYVRRADGTVERLDRETEPPLGFGYHTYAQEHGTLLERGSVLVLYTDGLIESRKNLFEGERRMADALALDGIVHAANAARFVTDAVLYDGVRDDVAVLCTFLGRRAHWTFNSNDAMSAQGVRTQFVARLRADGSDDSDYAGAELIFGELVGNVVRYAPGAIDIDLDWSRPQPVLHVMDKGEHFEAAAQLPGDALSESGRGLFIIASLGAEFSVEQLPGRGNHVRVTLPVWRRTEER